MTMATEPAPYQHRNLSQFIPDNHNIGLTDEQLVTISTKEFNRRLKNSGNCCWCVCVLNLVTSHQVFLVRIVRS